MNGLPASRMWFWPSEVAGICHLSRATVYNWIEAGKIQTLLNVKPFKIPRQEVEKLINRNYLSI